MGKGAKSRTITFDDKCYLIDQVPQWFLAGCIHYFRVPRRLWENRILAAKRAGLNTIQTYIPWNYHEISKGKFDFRGERNLNEFLKTCQKLDMFVIIRPGPYICAEWDFGGLPAYLVADPDVEYRTKNKAYLKAVDRYLSKVLPIIVANQVTRDGPIVLVQNENEYRFWGRPGGRAYLQHINRSMRRAGVKVPIVTCNYLAERIPDTIETWNGWDDLAAGIRALRDIQPDTPKAVTEFWPGWYRSWNGPVVRKTPRDVHRYALEALSLRAMYSYYMFHGGTNFEYWGSRSAGNEFNFMTTSYDYDAPLSEGGGLTPKYYESKLANQIGQNFADFFTTAEISRPRASASQGFEVRSLRSEAGEMLFVFRQREQRSRTAQLKFRNRKPLDVDMSGTDAGVFLYRFEVAPGRTIDFLNLTVMGIVGDKTPCVLAHGGANFRYRISVNGNVLTGRVPRGDAPELVEIPSGKDGAIGLKLLIMNRDLARRTWFIDTSAGSEAYLGPKYVGAQNRSGKPELVGMPGKARAWKLSADGELTRIATPTPTAPPALPLLRGWRSWSALPEILGAGRGWQNITVNGKFSPPESVGYDRGYIVYRSTIRARKSGQARILFTDAGDRLHIFVNGEFITTWGQGEGVPAGTVTLPLREGPNDVRVLVDNLGRFCFGYQHFGEHKGIVGDIYVGARELRLSNVAWRSKETVRRQHLDTWEMVNWVGRSRREDIIKRLKKGVPNQSGTSLSATFRLDDARGALLQLRDVRAIALVFINGELIYRHYGEQDASFANIRLDDVVHGGLNDLLVQFVGSSEQTDSPGPVRLFAFRTSNRLATDWQVRPLRIPLSPPEDKTVHRLAERMSCYRVTFKTEPPGKAVFVELAGLGKGQIFFNGHNLGRYWHIEAPHQYYLPEPFFGAADELNEIVVFEELEGFRPQDVRLLYAVGPRSEELY